MECTGGWLLVLATPGVEDRDERSDSAVLGELEVLQKTSAYLNANCRADINHEISYLGT